MLVEHFPSILLGYVHPLSVLASYVLSNFLLQSCFGVFTIDYIIILASIII